MKKMNDQVKYQLERAEDALRTALTFANKESVYVIAAISKALTELDNTMFAERIEAATKEGNTAAQGLISINKEEQLDGSTKFTMSKSVFNMGGQTVKSGMKWNTQVEFSPAQPAPKDFFVEGVDEYPPSYYGVDDATSN